MSVRLDNFVDVNITKRVSTPGMHKFDTAVFIRDFRSRGTSTVTASETFEIGDSLYGDDLGIPKLYICKVNGAKYDPDSSTEMAKWIELDINYEYGTAVPFEFGMSATAGDYVIRNGSWYVCKASSETQINTETDFTNNFIKLKNSYLLSNECYFSANGSGAKSGVSKEHSFAYVKGLSGELDGFFANGGKYAHVVYQLSESEDGKSMDLPVDEIAIVYPDDSLAVQSLIGKVYTGVYQKIYFGYKSGMTTVPDPVAGFFKKYESAKYAQSGSLGATAAYFTKFDFKVSESVKDYAFTEELGIKEIVDDDAVVKFCIENHVNCDVYLAGAVRNIGGDDTTGESIVNVFMRIVLQQTLTDTLVNLLASKIKMNTSGIIAVKAAVGSELTKYVNNGYIATDKSWTEEDLYIGNKLVVKKNTPITGGFYVYIPPISSLTPEQKEAHQLPDVYVIYGDSEGVRKIIVNGEVF